MILPEISVHIQMVIPDLNQFVFCEIMRGFTVKRGQNQILLLGHTCQALCHGLLYRIQLHVKP